MTGCAEKGLAQTSPGPFLGNRTGSARFAGPWAEQGAPLGTHSPRAEPFLQLLRPGLLVPSVPWPLRNARL